MKKLLLVCLVCTALSVLTVAASVHSSDTSDAPDDGLEINFIKGNSKRDISVIFNHSSHESYDCVQCHHKMDRDEYAESCATCHDDFKAEPQKGYKSYFKAMHVKRDNPKHQSCLSCHVKEFGNDPEMTGCTQSVCHPEGIR